MNTETSAGSVVVRYRNRRWEVLLLKDMNNNWTFPKGLIELHESAEQAAKREAYEEVGISDITVRKALSAIRYFYKREGNLIDKTILYFLCTSKGLEELKPQKEEGIQEASWVPLIRAAEMIGYPKTNKKLLEETEGILKERKFPKK